MYRAVFARLRDGVCGASGSGWILAGLLISAGQPWNLSAKVFDELCRQGLQAGIMAVYGAVAELDSSAAVR